MTTGLNLIYVNANLKDTSTGVEVSGPLPKGCILQVVEIDSEDAAFVTARQSVGGNDLLLLFDISLLLNDTEVQPGGEVTVSIPLPEEYRNRANLMIAHIDDSGNVSYIEATVSDGVMTFTTDHFSSYAVVDMAATTPVTKTLAKTEDGLSGAVMLLLSTTILSGSVLGGILFRKRRIIHLQ